MFLILTQNTATALGNLNCGVESVNVISEHFIRNSIKNSVFSRLLYQLNYICKGPQTHRGVCLDHLEPFIISFKTFEKNPRNYV